MSNKVKIIQNNTELSEILNIINMLPEQGSDETEISLQDKIVTENGTYTADSGYDGLGTVTVAVPEIEVNTCYVGDTLPDAALGVDNDIFILISGG